MVRPVINLKRARQQKAVSPIIGVVLMIAVALSISVIVFIWASGLASKHATADSADTEQIVIEQVTLNTTNLTVYLRNKNKFDVIVDTVYVNDRLEATKLDAKLEGDSVTPIDLTSLLSSHGGNGSFNKGDRVTLVTMRGTQIKFDAGKR